VIPRLKPALKGGQFIAALKRCATQNQLPDVVFPQPARKAQANHLYDGPKRNGILFEPSLPSLHRIANGSSRFVDFPQLLNPQLPTAAIHFSNLERWLG
jgi:hypothetical protein